MHLKASELKNVLTPIHFSMVHIISSACFSAVYLGVMW